MVGRGNRSPGLPFYRIQEGNAVAGIHLAAQREMEFLPGGLGQALGLFQGKRRCRNILEYFVAIRRGVSGLPAFAVLGADLPGLLLRSLFSRGDGFRLRCRRFLTVQGNRIAYRHPVVLRKVVIFNDFNQFGRILRICGITRLLQAVRPGLIIRQLILEEELITVPITQEITVVAETFIGRAVHPETLVPAVIVHLHGLALPVVELLVGLVVRIHEVTAAPVQPSLRRLDPEMVVSLGSQLRLAVTGLQQPLRQGNAGRDTGPVHFTHRGSGVFGNIFLLRGFIGRNGQDGAHQDKHQEKPLHKTVICSAKIANYSPRTKGMLKTSPSSAAKLFGKTVRHCSYASRSLQREE